MTPYAASITSDEQSHTEEEDANTALEQLWEMWDVPGADEDYSEEAAEAKAREVWNLLNNLCAKTDRVISAITTFGEESPIKFAKFLRINNAPGSKWLEEGHENLPLCMLLFRLQGFEKMPSSSFDCMAPCELYLFGKSGKAGSRHSKVVRRLLWVVNFVLDNTPDHVYEHLKRARMYTQGLFGTDTDRAAKLLGEASKQQLSMALPFNRPGNLLRCFGYNREAVGYTKGLEARKTSFVTVDEILGVMDNMNRHFESLFEKDYFATDPSTAWEAEGPISLESATKICEFAMNIEPLFWTLTESTTHAKGPYRKNRDSLNQMWKEMQSNESINDNDKTEAIKDAYKRMVEQDESPVEDSEPPGVDVDDVEVGMGFRIDDFHKKASGVIKKKAKKAGSVSNKKRGGAKAQFDPSVRLEATFRAAGWVVSQLEKDGRPVDQQLCSGCDLWAGNANAPVAANVPDEKRPKSIMRRLGEGGAPTVAGIDNSFSDAYLMEDRRVSNMTHFCHDDNSGGGTSSIGAFFDCRACGNEGDVFSGPVVKVGQHSICSVQASTWEKRKMAFATEISDIFLDATNAILLAVRAEASSEGVAAFAGDTAAAIHYIEPNWNGRTKHLQMSPNVVVAEAKKIVKLMKKLGRWDDIDQANLAPYPRQVVNLNICKTGIKAAYSAHQDSSFVLNSHNLVTCGCVANGDVLPMRWEMPVVTFITGNDCPANLSWTLNGVTLASLLTTTNYIHLQFQGVQWFEINHRSDLVDKNPLRRLAGSENKFRKIDTNRMIMCPNCDEHYKQGIRLDKLGEDRDEDKIWKDYSRTNVCEARPSTDQNAVPARVADGISSGATVEVQAAIGFSAEQRAALVPRKFATVTYDLLQQMLTADHRDGDVPVRKLIRPATKIGCHERYRHTYSRNWRFITRALEMGHTLQIVDADFLPVSDQPLFLHDELPLRIGQELRFSELPIQHSKMATCVVEEQAPMLAVFIHAYKNDPNSFHDALEFAEYVRGLDLSNETDFRAFVDRYTHRITLSSNGFAGSMQKSDNYAPEPDNIGPDDAHITTGHQQSFYQRNNAVFQRILEQGRVLAVFMCVDEWGEQRERDQQNKRQRPTGSLQTKKKKDVDMKCTFLGYHKVVQSSVETLTDAQVQARFARFPDQGKAYLRQEEYNLNHMLNGFITFKLVPAFDENIIRKMDAASRNRTPLDTIKVWDGDTRPLTIPFEKLKEHCTSLERLSCVTESMVLDYVCTKYDNARFTKEMRTPTDENLMRFLPPRVYAGSLELNDAAAVVLNVAAANAMRSQRQYSTVLLGQPPLMYASPLVSSKSYLLPDPLRLAPLPSPNADFDCNVQFALCQTKKLVEHVYSKETWDVDGVGILVDPELKPELVMVGGATYKFDDTKLASCVNEWILRQCLFMIIICRFTGNTQVLAKYDGLATDAGVMHLPLTSQAHHFVNFLREVKKHPNVPSVTTKQHDGSLPDEIKETSERFWMLIEALANGGSGHRKLFKILGAHGVSNKHRVAMKRKIMECIAECGDLQQPDDLGFVSHKVLADLETAFLGVVGEVTLDSIDLGWGSKRGLDCLKFPELPGGNSTEERLMAFHDFLIGYLKQQEHEQLANACGYEIFLDSNGNRQIRSRFSHREFSLADTEHFLCKIWLAILHSHASRNIAANKKVSVAHCQPLCEPGEWEEHLTPYAVEMWNSFVTICSRYPYPSQYLYSV